MANITLSEKEALVIKLRDLLTKWNLIPTYRPATYDDYTTLHEQIYNVCNQLDAIEQQEKA